VPAAVALLRAVNLGSHQQIAMAGLRTAMEAVGFTEVRTLLQSGNVVFAGGKSGVATEERIEAAIAGHFGFTTQVMVRSASEWRKLIAGNPFTGMAEQDPGHLVLMALKQPAEAAAVEALRAAIRGREEVRGGGRDLYVTYPEGIGRSKLGNQMIEKHLGSRCTGRNWNTVLKLAALLDG
jgi:uncharacterized protein (DUF1697 family)